MDEIDNVSSGRERVAQLVPGDVLGRYQLLLPIATGGMGKVWVARQRGNHGFRKLVALKTTLAHLAKNPEFEKYFLDEARIASMIQHPHVCSILELGDEDGVLYMALEWVGGSSLAQLLASQPNKRLDPRIAARIIAQACSGLHAAHELCDEAGAPMGVIHRDVTPQNLLLTPDGHVKVADFGVAKARDQLHHTTTGEVRGKISYMAPEQFATKTYDRRADVFALGCVLYEAVVGAKAFDAGQVATIYHILEGRFERPSALIPGFAEDLEAIILRALARSAADRYQTADEMRAALEDWLARSGPPCTEVDVARVLQSTLGEPMSKRTRTIHDAIQNLEGKPKTSSQGELPSVDITFGAGVSASSTLSSADPGLVDTVLADGGESNQDGLNAVERSREITAARQLGSSRALFGVVMAFALIGGGLAAVRTKRERAEVVASAAAASNVVGATLLHDERVEPVAAGLDAGAPERIQVSVRVTPANAVLTLDDGAPLANPYRGDVPRDGKAHTFRASAPDREDESRTVTFDASQTIELSLRQRPAVRMRPGNQKTGSPATTDASKPIETDPLPMVRPAAGTKRQKPIDQGDPFAE